MSPGHEPGVWFPTVRAGTGTDVFTRRLVDALTSRGIRAEITWLPLRAEYAPWTVRLPKPPPWATVAHVNTWLHPRFLSRHLRTVATIHHSVHHVDARAYKGLVRALYHSYWFAPGERRVMRHADAVVAVSHFVADAAREALVDVPMQVIYNGVDTEQFRPGQRQRKPEEPFRLLYVGGWKKLKGVDLLAPIMRALGNGFHLRYTGGPDAAAAREYLPENMHDIGRLVDDDAVVAAMQEADALLFPSHNEGFGLVAVEAMACGLPVVATRGSSLPEVIADETAGLLCTPGDARAFTAAVRRLARDEFLQTAIAVAARGRAVEKFSEAATVDAYLTTYRRVLGV